MRPNLVYVEQTCEGRTYHVVKDPITLAYFRLDEGQYFAVGLMDGQHTLDEIQKAYEERFRPERLSLEELEAFAVQLLDAGLAQNESPLAGQLLHERSQKHRRQALKDKLLNFLAIKIPLVDPDRLLGQLAPRLRFLFSTAGVLAGLGLVLAALALIVTHWGAFVGRLPTHRDFFTAHTLVTLWLALGLSRVLHELGHGLTCKLQGGTVHEAGVLLLIFFPALYCNVSDSWTLPSKWWRMAIAAAGIYIDLLIAALATFAWWASVPGTLVHDLSFALLVACGISTLVWNANPLMRFDGYYVLSDWLEVPNLAEQSSRFLQGSCLRWFGLAIPADPVSRHRPTLLASYAVASYLYRIVVTVAVLSFLFSFLKPYKLDTIGIMLGLAALLVMVGRPAWGLAVAIHAQGRWSNVRPARFCLVLGALLGLGGLFFAFPFSMSVEGTALVEVEPNHVQRVVVPSTGGFLQEASVRDGQQVRAGDVLAILTNPKLEVRLRVNEVDQALRARQRSNQIAQLSDTSAEAQAVAGLQQAEFELKALTREHVTLRQQRDRLILRAPCDGVVMGLVSIETKGKWLERGTEVCRVGDPRALRAVLLIQPADHRLLQAGSRATARAHGLGSARWAGTLTEVAQVEAKRVPPQLSSRAGGEVATEQDSAGIDRPRTQHYLASVRLHETGSALQPGTLGRVKIETVPRTGWWRLRRYLGKTFNGGL